MTGTHRAPPILAPIPEDAPRIDLCGRWRYAQPLAPDFPAGALPGDHGLSVPGEIVMQGLPFDPAQDAALETDLHLPTDWAGHAIRLRFGAVYSECEVFLDGGQVGAHLGGFTAFDIDLTGRVRPGADHRLTLRLRNTSIADEIGFMTRYADHPLAGILRGVTLFALPPVHLTALRIATEFGETLDDALLRLTLGASAPCDVTLRLTDPDGAEVARWQARAPGESAQPVNAPHLWHPEHPHLYTLSAEVAGAPCRRAVGFREVVVADRRLTLNRRPILLRGVNHHETHPLTGRADTARWAETDVRAFKAAHVNFLRTSHYPPTPELLDACDRLGMLVEVENAVCFAFGQFDYTKRWDDWTAPEQVVIADYIVTGAREMVAEHGHHPSVILWSVANESQWALPFEAAAAAIRADDPTRPRTFNWYKMGPECRDHVEIANHHYPAAGEVARFADEPRPVLFDEFAHLYCYNDREMLTDPGLRGLWDGFLAQQWGEIRALPNAAGGTVWAAIDDWFLLPQPDGTRHGVGYGAWGLLDGWRRPKPELEGMASVWDPIYLPKRQVAAGPSITIPVENRCDATNLAAFTVEWEMGGARGTLPLRAAPGETVPVDLPDPPSGIDVVSLRFRHRGLGYDRIKRVAIGVTHPAEPAEPAELAAPALLAKAGSGWNLGDFHLSRVGDLSGPDGLWIGGPDVALIPRRASRQSGVRQSEPAAPVGNAATQARILRIAAAPDAVFLHMAWSCAEGTVQLGPLANGSLALEWDFTLTAPFKQWQAGIVLAVPRRFNTLHWQRAGLHDPLPDDHPDRPTGRAAAFRPDADDSPPTIGRPTWPWSLDQTGEGTNDFRSTKRDIARARLTDAQGCGLEVVAAGPLHLRAAMAGPLVHLHLLTASDHGSERFLESFAPLTDLAPGSRLTGGCRLIALSTEKDFP